MSKYQRREVKIASNLKAFAFVEYYHSIVTHLVFPVEIQPQLEVSEGFHSRLDVQKVLLRAVAKNKHRKKCLQL